MPIKVVDQDKPLLVRLSKLIVHAQFVWWLGHITVVYASIFYLVSKVLGQESSHSFYLKVFRGSILSYGIVIWKGHKPFEVSFSYFKKVISDETTSYLLLALYWMLTNSATVAVIPYFVYSIFHCINYIRTRLFPALLPQAAEELRKFNQAVKSKEKQSDEVNHLSPEAQFIYRIQQVTLERYAPCMKLVALFEVVVVPIYLLVGFFPFGFSIVTIFVYSQFLLRRAKQSPITIRAFNTLDNMIQSNLDHPPAPPAVKQFYAQVRSFFRSLVSD